MDALPDWIVPEDISSALEYVGQLPQTNLLLAGFLSALFFLTAAALQVKRWRVLLDAQGLHYSGSALWRSWLSASAFGFLLPRSIGQDVWRFLDIARDSRRPAAAMAVLILEKAAGLVAFTLFVTAVALPGYSILDVAPAKLRFGIVVLGLMGTSAVALGVLLQPRILRVLIALVPLPRFIRTGLESLLGAVLTCAAKPGAFLHALVLSFGAWILKGLGLGIFFAGIASTGSVLESLTAGVMLPTAPALSFPIIRDTIVDVAASVSFSDLRPTLALAVMGTTVWVFTRVIFAALGVMALARRFLRGFSLNGTTTQQPEIIPPLSPDDTRKFRSQIFDTLLAGLGGGILGGALTGLLEASWMYQLWLHTSTELRMFWWSPLFYGLVFSVVGLGVSIGLVLLYLLLGRFRFPGGTLAMSAGATLAACFLVIGRFRYARDFLGERALDMTEIAVILSIALGLFVVVERLVSLSLNRVRLARRASIPALLFMWAILIMSGGLFGQIMKQPEYQESLDPSTQTSGPNIIFIVADTLRADYLPMYSDGAPAKTPHLNAFAQDAVVFKNSFSQASWTKPSFGTMFTGRYPSLHGATGKASVLNPDEVTLAELLRDAGYFTQAMPNNRNLLPAYGMHRGFVGYDFLVPRLYFGATFSVERFALYEVLRRVRIELQKPYMDIAHFYRPAPEVNTAARNWFDSGTVPEDAPFFLYLHYMDPHDPYMFEDQPGVGLSSMRLGINPDPDIYLQPITYAYIDEIERLDQAIGELFADLKRRNLYDESMIVFTSDHGEELYEHGGWSHGPTLYDEVTHVPIAIKFPGGRHAGVVNEDLARHLDIAPTILQQAGVPIPERMNGIALEDGSGTFLNGSIRESFAETDFTKIIATSIRTMDHKLIEANPGNPRGLEPVEFYDLVEDPGESTNLSGRGLAYESTLSDALDAYSELVSSDS